MLLERAKQVVEPAGAVGVAAILAGKVTPTGPTVSVLSGGNIDPLLLQRVVSHGLAASGRYMTLRIPLPDRPGQLARVSELLAHAGANVIEVMHTRHGQGLQISEVILQLSVETRGEEHRAHVIDMLQRGGLRADRRAGLTLRRTQRRLTDRSRSRPSRPRRRSRARWARCTTSSRPPCRPRIAAPSGEASL